MANDGEQAALGLSEGVAGEFVAVLLVSGSRNVKGFGERVDDGVASGPAVRRTGVVLVRIRISYWQAGPREATCCLVRGRFH